MFAPYVLRSYTVLYRLGGVIVSVSGVIRAALVWAGVGRAAMCARLGCTVNSWSAKLRRGSFTVADLVRVAAVLGLRLAFVDQAGAVVVAFPASLAEKEPPAASGSGSGPAGV